MKIIVDRFESDSDTTISRIFINGQFFCYGLEDEYRKSKVSGETRIPAGLYKVGVRSVGGMHNRYKKRFPDIHQGMLHIQDVPEFEYILIHCGNSEKDTAGCLLVGEKRAAPGSMLLAQSVSAYRRLYVQVIDAAIMGRLNILFEDNDLLKHKKEMP